MTTMAMDSLDIPMMDFTDDTAMQIGPSNSTNSWEALMEDDDGNSQFQAEDVEIDMETYELENPEYEMTDEASVNQPNPDELLDVEVFDASEEHRFLYSTNTNPPTALDENLPMISREESSYMPEVISEVTAPPVVDESHSPTIDPLADGSAPFVVGLSTDETPQTEVHPHDDYPKQDSGPEPQLFISDQLVTLSSPGHPTVVLEGSDIPKEQLQHTVNLSTVEASPASDLPEDHNTGIGDWQEGRPSEGDVVADHDSAGDPHEISEGIYIDPPPPVLLSLHPSAETFCLFNHPAAKNSAAENNEESDLVLLLHDLPTLYYEPLSKVFEVLRDEGYISNSYDLVNGELVMDAYELVDLVISEDNIHAREISLHDLNILHDISDLPGPLCIRLECRPSRFISRYRFLRSELERLHVNSEENRGLSVGGDDHPAISNDAQEIHAEPYIHPADPNQVDPTELPGEHEELDQSEHLGQGDAHPDAKNEVAVDDNLVDEGEIAGEPDPDADGDTDPSSLSVADATETHASPAFDALDSVQEASAEFEVNEAGNELDGEDDVNQLGVEEQGEGAEISGGDVEGDSEQWTAEIDENQQPEADVALDNAPVTIGDEVSQNKRSEVIDLTGDGDSEEVSFDDDASTLTERLPVDTPHGEVQLTETNPDTADEEGLDAAGSVSENFEPGFDPEGDNFDDIDWNDEELDRELEEGEDEHNFELASIETASSNTLSSKTSSKRGFDEVEETQEEQSPLDFTPDSKKRQKTL